MTLHPSFAATRGPSQDVAVLKGAISLACALFVAACGTASVRDDAGDPDPVDASAPDATPLDVGPPDAGPHDAGPHDAGAPLPARTSTSACLIGGTYPSRLSETGCFSFVPTLTPSPEMIPFGVASPLWSDGTGKERYLALPPGTHVDASDPALWLYPLGTIFVKTFAYAPSPGADLRPLEVRFMRLGEDGYTFATYRFDDDGRDAQHLAGADWPSQDRRYTVLSESGPETRRWLYPSEQQCLTCHRGTEMLLGPVALQLDLQHDYGHVVADQLTALDDINVFDGTLARPESPLPSPSDEAAPLESRARAYIHANCAHCHRPGGYQPIGMTLDLRYGTPLVDTRACGEPIQFTSIPAGTHRIWPGHKERSNIWQRLRFEDDGRMPPLAVSRVDPVGVEVVGAWIDALVECPE